MNPGFFPYPYPVQTPLGEGYALYVTPSPMYENDSWCVQLDDGRILHFSTNQLRAVGNGTYDLAKPEAPQSNLAAASRGMAAKLKGEAP